MKRNWDLIRMILLRIQDLESSEELTLDDFKKEEQEEIYYQIKLLNDAGFIEMRDRNTLTSRDFLITATALTWQGNEFIDSIKSDSLWMKTKLYLKENSIALGFESIKMTALILIKQSMS
jgi:hypothetical protein